MQKNKSAMRRAILRRLFEHLEEYYGIDWSRETFIDGQLSMHQIDAMIAFKSDARLNELRAALNHLEDGSYGICIGCKREIEERVLALDPARRFCTDCEQDFNHALTDDVEQQWQW